MAKTAKSAVFIVDHEPKVCEVICETLENSGIVVRCFTDPVQCLERISSEGCDLLITHLKMPEMDGLELMRRAKFLIPWMPVVIVTAYGNIPTAVEASHAGVAYFIEKPLVKDDFIRKIRSLFPSTDGARQRLTKTEACVLRFVAMGKSSSEIAHILHRSPRTIEKHRSLSMQKLGLKDFTDLIKLIGGAEVPEYLANHEQNQKDT